MDTYNYSNFEKLFDVQKELDNVIRKTKRLGKKTLVSQKIAALTIELGEMANELPEFFKHWKKDKNNYETALYEYIDGLHFVLSIGIELDIKRGLRRFKYKEEQLIPLFNSIIESIADLNKGTYNEITYYILFDRYLKFGEQLGFTEEQVLDAYYTKNKINHERQAQGY